MSNLSLDWSGAAAPPRRGRAGDRRTVLIAVGLVVVAVVAAVAYFLVPWAVDTFEEKRLSGGCGVVVDGSPSGDAKTGFDVVEQLRDSLPAFLDKTDCKTVAFSPIDGSSEISPCTARSLDLDPEVNQGGVARESLWASRRADALKRAESIATCIRSDPRSRVGSDVLGGLKRSLRERPEDDSHTLLVVSDFVNNDNNLVLDPKVGTDIRTPERRAAVLTMLEAKDRIPDLADVRVFTAGYGVTLRAVPEEFSIFDAFWTELMEVRAGCSEFRK